MTFSLFALLLVLLHFKHSTQSCSSTAAITTCPWDTLTDSKPLQIPDYKSYLSFSKGNLETIPNGAFKNLPYVNILQLNSNKIKQLGEQALEGLYNLKQLHLYDNQLTAVSKGALKECRGLEKLDLGMNKIATVDPKAFESLTSLTYLNLAFNSLKAVPEAVNTLPHLRLLRLDNNAITVVKASAFSNLGKLEELSLNDNKLTKIEDGCFAGLGKLKRLDLRSNFLTDVNVRDVLRDARSLEMISLSLNDFKCDSLGKILDDFKKNRVQVSNGVSRSPNNVNGISCKK